MTDKIVIKKYGNRRLYDTGQSAYITLDGLAQIIRGGATVQVVEASSEQDITRQVLTQVILDQQERLDLLPVELLHAIIRVQGTLEQAPLATYLSLFTRQFLENGTRWTRQMSSLLGGLTSPIRPAGKTDAPDEPAEADRPADEPDATPNDEKTADADPATLKARMSALLERLDTRR